MCNKKAFKKGKFMISKTKNFEEIFSIIEIFNNIPTNGHPAKSQTSSDFPITNIIY